MDHVKIKYVHKWTTPINESEVRSFMSLAKYYKKLIESFSQIANMITSLQNKGVKFIWNQKCEYTIKLLKELLTCAPILQIMDLDKEYVVCTAASLEGLGGVFDARWARDLI